MRILCLNCKKIDRDDSMCIVNYQNLTGLHVECQEYLENGDLD